MSVQVYVQSNLFPRLRVVDTSQPPGFFSKLVKIGYEVDVNGVTLYQSPEQPTVAPAIQYAAAALIVGAVGFLIWRFNQ